MLRTAACSGVVADDLTGANAVAALAAVQGIPAWTGLGPVPRSLPPDDALLVTVDTATRDAGVEDARVAVEQCVQWFQGHGIAGIAKRIDSTLRGHAGVEVEVVLAALGGGHVAVVSPAFPAAGRTVQDGRVLVNGRPLHEVTGVADDAVAALRYGTTLDVQLVALARVRSGAHSLAAHLRTLARPAAALVFDAETDGDLRSIAAAVQTAGFPALAVDPGPLTLALSGLLGAPPNHPAAPDDESKWMDSPPVLVDVKGVRPVLAVFGSAEPAADRQVERAIAAGAVKVLDLSEDELLAGRAVKLGSRLADQLSSNAGAMGLRVAPRLGLLASRGQVATALAAIVRETLLVTRPGALYLSGGAVARAVLDALEADGIMALGHVQPLAAYGRLTGGPFAGLPVVTKGGLAGGEDAVLACLTAPLPH